MRVLAIDPGTANCGFAVLDAVRTEFAVAELGTFRAPVKDANGKKRRLRDRVDEYVIDLADMVDASKPHIVVAEAPNFPKGAKAAAMLWSAYTGLVAICHCRGVQLALRNPGEWRRMVGLPVRPKGQERERKEDTRQFVTARYPSAPLLLEDYYADAHEHAYDALGIAISWTDRATETPTQGELAWQER